MAEGDVFWGKTKNYFERGGRGQEIFFWERKSRLEEI